MPNFIQLMKYRQKRVTVKEILSLVFRILVILEKILSLNRMAISAYLNYLNAR